MKEDAVNKLIAALISELASKAHRKAVKAEAHARAVEAKADAKEAATK
jgi:hypothetical protein